MDFENVTENHNCSTAMVRGNLRKRVTGKKHNSKVSTHDENTVKLHLDQMSKKAKQMEQQERQRLVLWRKPFWTIRYFIMELIVMVQIAFYNLYRRKKMVLLLSICMALVSIFYVLDGPHHKIITLAKRHVLWWVYWIGLGILSSVGLGTGLHTFLLYLGPHIASVTLAAYECKSVNFPEPPYPLEILCPESRQKNIITLWTIMSKVRLEALMWGAGTAIGELPPYFMARAARLSGQEHEEEFEEIEELLDERATNPSDLSVLERLKLTIHGVVQKVGFFGILACASIPNPLFDLAGITCGHFLIPFWTFFGATLIGKSIIKMHIQKLFVIFVFSDHHVDSVVKLIRYIPRFGPSLQMPFKNWLTQQKSKLHHRPGQHVAESSSVLAWIFEKVVIIMVIYFLLSIINSMAQSYHKKLCSLQRETVSNTDISTNLDTPR